MTKTPTETMTEIKNPMNEKRADFRFFHRLRVRWAEVDMQKIVFNAHYLMYFDTAIADYWRALALPYEEAMPMLGGDLYVRGIDVSQRTIGSICSAYWHTARFYRRFVSIDRGLEWVYCP